MSRGSHIVNYDDRAINDRYLAESFDEEARFRKRMKSIEELVTSGDVASLTGKSVGGQRVRVVHRMGDRFDVQVADPFTKKARTVVSHQYDLLGNRRSTDVAWTPGDPRSVAAVFGIPFVSAFGDPPRQRAQSDIDREDVERAEHDEIMKYRIKFAKNQGFGKFVWGQFGRANSKNQVPLEYQEEWVKQRKRRGLPYD